MQVQPATWRRRRACSAGAAETTDGNADRYRHLREMLREFGDVRLALAAYNQGPSSLRRHGVYSEAARYAARACPRRGARLAGT